jgi:hypothetical protein
VSLLLFSDDSFIQWEVASIYRPSQCSTGFYITYKVLVGLTNTLLLPGDSR